MNRTPGHLSRRELLLLAAAVSAGLVRADDAPADDLHQFLLDLAARDQASRRERFAAIKGVDELNALQATLRETFLRLLGGLPEHNGPPPATATGRIEGDGYTIEKLAFESFPGYFVTALLYRPAGVAGPAPGVVSPCGHSEVGKAAAPYQTLHINLARRGFVVLTYDPVGQGERSQFWDAGRGRSRFNLTCGEHAALGGPLDLLGTGLARYRIWDGMRAVDYLASLPEVDPRRMGCVGNSGGGNLTAYLTALDRRIAAAAICCYTTALPRRMANRIEADPDSDPEQDVFGFVAEGIDHAGLLALCAPRPTLLGTARLDFFPIEGARETFAEARRLYEVAGAGDRIERVEAPGRHGLSQPLREAVYGWFRRWLQGRDDAGGSAEHEAMPRRPEDLRVCPEGQASQSFRSRPLLAVALGEFDARPKAAPRPLREVLRIDADEASPRVTELVRGEGRGRAVVACVNGNEAPDWREERDFLAALERAGHRVVVIDPRGAGPRRARLEVAGREYADPLAGVEANLAYNAYLVGRTLLGLRVADVAAAVRGLAREEAGRRVVLCGRRDAGLAACFAAAVEPAVSGVAAEEVVGSYRSLFGEGAGPINAASVVPGLLREFGDIPEVLAGIAPRRVLMASAVGGAIESRGAVVAVRDRFTAEPRVLIDWLRG